MPHFKFAASFQVYGSCKECKKRIESKIQDLNGIHFAKWDSSTKLLSVEFDKNKISLDEIYNTINSIGYSTELNKTSLASYQSLPKSCRHNLTFNNILAEKKASD